MNGRLSQSFLQDALARVDIVDIIQTRVTLIKRGKNFVACCPFHSEKTPSFHVTPSKQFYYCFGCHAHGNAIHFLMNYDRMEFMDAVRTIATQAGLELPTENNVESKHDFNLLYDVMDQCAQFYARQLKESTPAIHYLKSRGLTGIIAQKFKIGYAKESWDNLAKTIGIDHPTQNALTQTGMLIRKENQQLYDRFRARIVFPIHNVKGRIIGFGGRTITNEQPKYLNSPESPLFHKSSELYGLYQALQANPKLPHLLIVEGYLDVISLTQAGILYSAATLGTAINAKHLQKILRYTNRITFCFDGDNAGRQAAWKALLTSLPILREGIHIQFLFLPEGEDPDSLIRKTSRAEFEQHIDHAQPLAEFFFAQLKREIPINTLDGKAHFVKEATQHLNTMPSGIFQKLLFDQLAPMVQLMPDDIHTLKPPTTLPTRLKPLGSLSPAQKAIAMLLRHPPLAELIPDIHQWQALEMPGITLLIQLLQIFQQDPTLTVGQLFLAYDSVEDKSEIARLSAYPLPIPETGLADEFKGAIQRLQHQNLSAITQRLLAKARHTELSQEEKKELQALLAYKAHLNKEDD